MGWTGRQDGNLKFHELRHTFATILLETPRVSREQMLAESLLMSLAGGRRR